MDEFQKIASRFIQMIEVLGKEVESQKIKAIGARNILQSMEKQKENNQQQLQVKYKLSHTRGTFFFVGCNY